MKLDDANHYQGDSALRGKLATVKYSTDPGRLVSSSDMSFCILEVSDVFRSR